MSDREQLVEQLTELEDSEFADLMEVVRRRRIALAPPPPELPKHAHPDSLAAWYAAQHMRVDPWIREVLFLPEGAPPGEIRLLEVNVNSNVPGDAPIEPIDFGVDRDLADSHCLLVADISTDQREQIRSGQLLLPPGWSLTGHWVFGRRGGG